MPGAIRVVNLIKVTGKARPDRDIEKEVVFYLMWAPHVDLDAVEYSVEDGHVKLRGSVDYLTNKFALASDIEKIRGVRSVDVSEITVNATRHSRAAGA